MKAVIIDQGVQEEFDALVTQKAKYQTGLLLGHCDASRLLVLARVPTPAEEDDANPHQWTAGKKQMLSSHASVVSRMTFQGLDVIGWYAFAREAEIKALEQRGDVADVVATLPDASPPGSSSSGSSEKLFLCAPQSSRLACRVFSGRSIKPRSTAVKVQRLVGLHCFSASYHLDALVLVGAGDLEQQLLAGLAGELSTIAGATVKMSGASDLLQTVEKAFESRASGKKGKGKAPAAAGDILEHACRLFTPPAMLAAVAPCQDHRGLVRVRGTVCGRAYALGKCRLDQVVAMLKEDLGRSLRTRLALLKEEEEDDDDGSFTTPTQPREWALPRRFAVSWGAKLVTCDYCFGTEGVDDVVEHTKEYLGADVDQLHVTELERAAEVKARPQRQETPAADDEDEDDDVTVEPKITTQADSSQPASQAGKAGAISPAALACLVALLAITAAFLHQLTNL